MRNLTLLYVVVHILALLVLFLSVVVTFLIHGTFSD